MKKSFCYTAIAITVAVLLSGCGASNTVKGTAIGVGAGAAAGAGIGKVAGNTALGAVIGAAVGGATGAIIGKKMDSQKKEIEKSVPNAKVETINEGEALRVTFDSGILFATNSSSLSDASINALSKFAESLRNNPDTNIKVIGHTDSTGGADLNQTLSEKRAQSVYNFLASQGVNYARMGYEGKGFRQPVADNNTAVGRQQNRRVEILILAGEKMINDARNGNLR